MALLLGNGLLDATGRVESSSRGFGAVSSTVDSRDASRVVLGFEMGVFWRAGFGRFFLTPVILLRFACSSLLTIAASRDRMHCLA